MEALATTITASFTTGLWLVVWIVVVLALLALFLRWALLTPRRRRRRESPDQ